MNTVPLVWGALHGPQKGLVDLTFAVPSICADRIAQGSVDVGIIPVIEMARQKLAYVPGIGIACRGEVRSILLISKVPFSQIRTLAADTSSRTSVQLARIILSERYHTYPEIVPRDPDYLAMLEDCDACLVIGDAALMINPEDLNLAYLDLGTEWGELTGLPMVFAVWSGRPEHVTRELGEILEGSCLYGLANLDRIIEEESERRGFPEWLVQQYLTRNTRVLLGRDEEAGMKLFLEKAMALDALPALAATPQRGSR